MRLMPCLRNNSYNAQQYATVLSGRSRVGSDGAEWGGRVGGYKSAMGGSRGGITVRSTCGRVNSTDATKISIRRDSSRIMATPTSGNRDILRFLFYKTFANTSNFRDIVTCNKTNVCAVWRERFEWHVWKVRGFARHWIAIDVKVEQETFLREVSRSV